MMFEQEVKKVSQELWDRFCNESENKDLSASLRMFQYTLEGRASDLIHQLMQTVNKQQRELDVANVQAETWKQSYLDQVRENVKYQAEALAAKGKGE